MKIENEMPYKDLLLQLGTYRDVTSAIGVDKALGVASCLGGRLTALTLDVDIAVPANPLALPILDVQGMATAEHERCVQATNDLLSVLNASAARAGVQVKHYTERTSLAYVPDVVIEYARLKDLTMIPIGDGTLQPYIAERVIFGAGRPVLLLPDRKDTSRDIVLDTIAVAWDFSRPAARALGDALPLLQRAKVVRVVTVANEKRIETTQSNGALATHLAFHGVDAIFDEEDAAGRTIGQALEAYARRRDLDLLVMGAYGHSRFRDFILGGATKSIVTNPPLPVLLSH
ncbi:universal stress protein [Xanthobacter sp. KR7-65]|uniref:universal stress protein n=1 Tax=Xanthobacter sp. KR7-65 TaxID=3156612 RepID=UPI0032B3F507